MVLPQTETHHPGEHYRQKPEGGQIQGCSKGGTPGCFFLFYFLRSLRNANKEHGNQQVAKKVNGRHPEDIFIFC